MIDLLFSTAKWWLVVTLLGAAGLPLGRRLFDVLPDRGLAFARPLGLLFAGLLYWLGVMAGILPNSRLGAWIVALACLGFGTWLARRDGLQLRSWWREQRNLIVGYELIFMLALLAWAFYRGFNPNIETSGGEKYMEMAFISAILESPSFPPLDPWLSGGTISYYYFGYIIAGLLTHLSFVPRFEAFNLLVPMTLALTLVAACGIGWNLAALAGARRWARWVTGLLSGLLLALMGSLEGFLELAYIRGWFSKPVFDWLAIKNLGGSLAVCGEAGSGYGAGGWVPGRFIWWWRGSRVITDVDPVTGGCREVIHEFPFFSFMLADAHPHVLTLPFALLVLAFALAVLAGGFELGRERDLWSPRFMAMPVAVGALGFLNTWDLPTYGFVLVCAYSLRALARPAGAISFQDRASNLILGLLGMAGMSMLAWRGASMALDLWRGIPADAQQPMQRATLALPVLIVAALVLQQLWLRWRAGDVAAGRLLDSLRFGVWLAGLSILLYAPFYLGFSSQASGIGVTDVRSRLPQWLVHFGPLFYLCIGLLGAGIAGLVAGWRERRLSSSGAAIGMAFGAITIFAIFSAAWTAAVLASVTGLMALAALEGWLASPACSMANSARAESEGEDEGEGEDEAPEAPAADEDESESGFAVALTFALLCAAVGLLMPLVTEFVFIRDLFGSRMNSIFKFYYQAWTLMALGGGFAGLAVWRRSRPVLGLGWAVPAGGLIAAGLVFTFAATWTRTNGFSAPEGLSLDGLRWWRASHAGDLEAAAWLSETLPRGTVVLEAHTAGGYAHNGRISMATGRPAVLGWSGHQHQWRGSAALGMLGERQADIEALYGRSNAAQMEQLLDEYGVQYAVIGNTERGMGYYQPGSEDQFARVMTRVWTSSDGQVDIYARRADTP